MKGIFSDKLKGNLKGGLEAAMTSLHLLMYQQFKQLNQQ